LWPDIPVIVREQPSKLIKHGAAYNLSWKDAYGVDYVWQDLEVGWLNYGNGPTQKGPVQVFIDNETRDAYRQNLKLVAAMNIVIGGRGSSGICGPRDSTGTTYWAMTADEIREYGTALINLPEAYLFMMWKFTEPSSSSCPYDYWERPDIQRAVQDLRDLADQRPWLPEDHY